MNVYASLPAPSYSFTDRAAESLIHLRRATQSRFTRELKARFELGALFVRSVVDCGLHVSMAGVCLTTAIVKVPVYCVLGGVTPKAALIDAGSHLIRAIKLVVVAPLALLAGLIRPEWSVDMYLSTGLVKLEPKVGLCASLIGQFNNVVATAMQSVNRQHVMAAAAALVTLVGVRYWSAQPAPFPLPYVPLPTNHRGYFPLLSILGGASVLGAFTVVLRDVCVLSKRQRLVTEIIRKQQWKENDYVYWLTHNGTPFQGMVKEIRSGFQFRQNRIVLQNLQGDPAGECRLFEIDHTTMVHRNSIGSHEALLPGDYVYIPNQNAVIDGRIIRRREYCDDITYQINGKEYTADQLNHPDRRVWRPYSPEESLST